MKLLKILLFLSFTTATVTDRSFEEKPKVEVYPKSKKDEKPIKGGKKEYSSKGD